ncbi:MAG: iron-containing redox enzyme family protein [Polyangiaceae bacterium]|nr:iron-containing redox enzyme family protein [Polyangiaceae bacterium]
MHHHLSFLAPAVQHESSFSLHMRLAEFNKECLAPLAHAPKWEEKVLKQASMGLIECHFVEEERADIAEHARSIPQAPDAFLAWFEALAQNGPGQGHPLFPWLAEAATLSEMKWFLTQEVAGEAGFDDLVALTQVKLPPRAKLELARNYWDEMGQGHAEATHGGMLVTLARELGLPADGVEPVWESLALSNLMLALAKHRHYTYQSIGALGIIELTAPGRAALVNAGLKRLGVSGEARRYFALHATLDTRHSAAWNSEVIRPLIAHEPRLAIPIAEGALMRLSAGARTFERYVRELSSRTAPEGVRQSSRSEA